MLKLFTEDKKQIILAKPITNEKGVKGEGGEGTVYLLSPASNIPNCNQYVAKIYKNAGDLPKWHESKLKRLVQIGKNPDYELKGICFPEHILYLKKGKEYQCVGFLMRCHEGDVLGQSILAPNVIKNNKEWTRVELTHVAIVILNRFVSLHKVGILMADINPGNIIIDGINAPFFIDVDSFQVENYPCPVCRIEFISQRLVNEIGKTDVFRNIEDEYYAIAVLLFMIFLVGKHPYTRRGKGSVERNLRDRNFIYPVGYDDGTNIPRGPYQRIWYNLPLSMRQTFYDVFHDGKTISPLEWKSIILQYQKDLNENRYPREIFPESEKPKASGVCLELSPQPRILPSDEAFRSFETVLCDAHQEPNPVFLEFGTNSFRCYESRGTGRLSKARNIKTDHFRYVNKAGVMDTKHLIETLMQPNNLPSWENYFRAFSPKYNRIIAFGGSLLRNLSYRDNVIEEFKRATGFNIGVLTLEEESDMLIKACDKALGKAKKKSMLLADVGGCTTSLSLRLSDKVIQSKEYFNIGRLVLQNRFFNKAFSDSRLLTMFEDHDKIISEQFGIYDTGGAANLTLVGIGVIKRLPLVIPSMKSKRSFTLKELETAIDSLTEELTVNRSLTSDLYDDITHSSSESLAVKTDLRLCLPVYIDLMKHLDINEISILFQSIGETYILNLINKIEQV